MNKAFYSQIVASTNLVYNYRVFAIAEATTDERMIHVGDPTTIEELERSFHRKFTFFATDNLQGVADKAAKALGSSERVSSVRLPAQLSLIEQKLAIIEELRSYHRNGGSKEEAERLFWKLMLLLCEDTAQIRGSNIFERKIAAYLNLTCTTVLRLSNSSNSARTTQPHGRYDKRDIAEEVGNVAADATGYGVGHMLGRWLHSLRNRDSGNAGRSGGCDHWWSGWGSGSSGSGGGGWFDF